LSVGATILGGLSSSRLDNTLVRGEQTAVSVTGGVQPFHRISMFEVTADVKPGQDADAVSRRLDEIIAEFVRTGPTADEVRRAVMVALSARIQGLEQVGGFGGKAVALAEGMLYANDPNFYRTRLERLARVTPAQVRTAMQRWLSRPVLAIRVDPGAREAYEEASGVSGQRNRAGQAAPAGVNVSTPSQRPRYYTPPQPGDRPLAPSRFDASDEQAGAATRRTRAPMPPVGADVQLDFPATERARLSNGIQVVYARRNVVPVTRIAVEFNAGIAADPANRLGTQAMMLNLLEEGTTRLNSIQIAEAQERLGATITAGANLDRTTVSLTTLTPNLGASLDLFADIVRNPAFAPAEVERIRQQQLAGIAAEMTQPQGLAARALPALLYGAQHPYGKPGTGTGDPAAVQALTRAELVAFHQSWIRPDNATIFAVGDLPLNQFVAQLESRFGTWRAPAAPRGTKTFPAHAPSVAPRIVLIDRPQSPQSFILAGQLLSANGTEDLLNLQAANEVLGGNFLSRLNMDLRERRGWSYGVGGGPNLREHQVPYVIQAPVQADRTGDSIAAALEDVAGFLGANGVTPEEMQRVINGNTRQLPGQYETSPAVLNALRTNALYHRPDDYQVKLADRYRGMTAQVLDTTARRYIDPRNFIWVVVGDATRVRPQLEQLHLPVEVITAPAPAAPHAH